MHPPVISDIFQASADSLLDNMHLTDCIENAAHNFIECFNNNGKVLICGNGGSAADAQHLSSELLNRYDRDRKELPGISLCTDGSTITSIANDFSYDQIFAKQIRALANPQDIVMLITTSGNSTNLIEALNAAKEKNASCFVLNGKDGGKIAPLLSHDDFEIRVKGTITARIQEVHGLIIHCICELIDHHIIDKKNQ
jgi:D-sedoheptulose 7-phosphate isomerase